MQPMTPPALRHRLIFQFQFSAAPTVLWLLQHSNVWWIINIWGITATEPTAGLSFSLLFFKCQTSDSRAAACPILVIYCSSPSRWKSGNVFMTQRVRLGLISSKLEKVGLFLCSAFERMIRIWHWLGFFSILSREMWFFITATVSLFIHNCWENQHNIPFPPLSFLNNFFCLFLLFFFFSSQPAA